MNALANECLERATYLKAMEPEGLSTIERQCMETLFAAAATLSQPTSERDRIVAWLRGNAERIADGFVIEAIDAIERGVHLRDGERGE